MSSSRIGKASYRTGDSKTPLDRLRAYIDVGRRLVHSDLDVALGMARGRFSQCGGYFVMRKVPRVTAMKPVYFIFIIKIINL